MRHDSSRGDAGSPLMKVEALDGTPHYYLLGVMSFGAKRCAAIVMPGFDTRVSEYVNWIMENMHI